MPKATREIINKAYCKNTFLVLFCVLIVAFDQYTKSLALKYLSLLRPQEVIHKIFYLTLSFNTGVAFGMFKNQTIFFVVISFIAAIVIIINILRSKNFIENLGFIFILAGAIGNLIDRLRYGFVVDFIDFVIWPVFNVADSFITIGAFIIIFVTFFTKPKQYKS
ncbi:MAG: signal peptidase II [Candidatus Gygaella obscura]|nr:signal peptidase II [Candidatus Gygaella obscura]